MRGSDNWCLGRALIQRLEFGELDMGAQFDLIENVLQLGVGEDFVTPGDRGRQLVQGSAGYATREQPVPHRIQKIEQLFAMDERLGFALRGIIHALQHQDGIQRGDGARAGHDLRMGIRRFGHGKAARDSTGRSLALDGGRLDPACAFDFQEALSHCHTQASRIMVKEWFRVEARRGARRPQMPGTHQFFLRAVVGMPGKNGQRAVDLLAEKGTRQEMRPGLGTEGEAAARLLAWQR